MKTKLSLRTKFNSGATLVEVLVSLGLLGIFAALSASVVKDIYDLTEKDKKQLVSQTDLTFAMGYLSGLFKDSGPSFGVIRGNTDNFGREFFDLINDVSTVSWSDPDLTRTLSLDPALGRYDFVFLVNDPKHTDQIYYNPIAAYQMPEPVEDMNSSQPLNYIAINNGSAISTNYSDIWTAGRLLLMRIPIPLRYVGLDGSINMNLAPREHSFLGKVVGNDLAQETLGGFTYTTHPITNNAVPSADVFLRTTPSVGGASPIIEVAAVKAIKISLVRRGSTDHYDLFSYIYSGGVFTNQFLFATNIKSVTFKRESVGLPLVGIKITAE